MDKHTMSFQNAARLLCQIWNSGESPWNVWKPNWSKLNVIRHLAMPLYEYELCDGECKVCGGKFTLRRPLSAKPLTNCPACKKPVRKIISTFNSPHKLKPLSITDAKKAGFTVLKKISKGEYERQ
jgi:putative FmdB family regulatory protein